MKLLPLPLLAALALTAAPVAAQTAPPAPPAQAPERADRNFDPNILLYIAVPAVVAILLAVAASQTSDGDRPASP